MKAKWFKKVGIGLYFTLLACLLVGAIVIALTNHTGGVSMILALFMGLLIGILTATIVHSITGSDAMAGAIALLPLIIMIFFSSWIVEPPVDGFAIKEGSGSIRIYERPTFTVPFAVKIHHIRDFTAYTEVSLLLDDEGSEVRWKAKLKLTLTADYNQVFSLLREFKSTTDWMAEIQGIFERVVRRYVAENIKAQMAVIPREFTFTLKNQKEEFSRLGFLPDGAVTAREIFRVVYKGD